MGLKSVETGGRSLPLSEFKFNLLVENPSILMIGKRGNGKSYVTRALLNHFCKIPVGIVIAPTDKMSCFYGNFFSDTFIHYKYTSEIIENLLSRQEKMIEKEKQKILKGKKIDSKAFIVMDDCLSSKGTWMKDGPIQELLFNGRHFKIMYILTLQYALGISPELRSNFDYIFLLGEDFVSNIKRLFDHYAGMFPSFNSFKEVFTQVTANFGCMVICNRGARATFMEKVFWYKAPSYDDKDIKMGCRQLRTFHEKNYNPDWRYKTKSFDISTFCNKAKADKNNNVIRINKIERDEEGHNLSRYNKKR